MKKVLAVFLAVLMAISALSVTVFAGEAEEPSTDEIVTLPGGEEETTRDIVSNDGTMVVPINFTQLKESFVFKLVEKIINFFLSMFGGADLDDMLSGGVSDVGTWLDEALSNIDGSLPQP
ncbi:MAG: hypothetical protein IK104_02045 [Clostridia bacterium]|nr:hypothetical protein [Clostridia bacterium]